MDLYGAMQALNELATYKQKGGKVFKEVDRILSSEATTYNIEEATKLLEELKRKFNGQNNQLV